MAISKTMIFALLTAAHVSAGPILAKFNTMKVSATMMAAKGYPPIASECGVHDFYAKIASQAQETVADCSVAGDIRADSGKLKQCLKECCATKHCIGISARSTGTKLVQSFMHAHIDDKADSYMLHEISQTVLGSEDASDKAKTGTESDAFTVSSVMLNMRGFPPMAAHCGRHDFYGNIGTTPSTVIGECSRRGDIRDHFQKLQMCLNECCQTDSCIGVSATANGTQLVKSFATAEVSEGSNSFMLHRPPKLTAKAAGEAESNSEEGSGEAASSDVESESETESKSETESTSEQGTKTGVAAAMVRAKGWPTVSVQCGKRYDHYGGIAGKASEELGDCYLKGDIRESYEKLKRCMEMCCKTDKCVGITARASGTKLIGSFAAVDEDEETRSYMQQ